MAAMTPPLRPRSALACALALAACSPPPTAPPPRPSAPAVEPARPAVAVPADSPARAAVLAAWRGQMPNWPHPPLVHGEPVAWPGGPDGSARVVAAVTATGRIVASGAIFLVATAVPYREGAASVGGPELRASAAPPAVAGLAVRDLDHDGDADVALFLAADDQPAAGFQQYLWAFTATASAPFGFAEMPAAQCRLLGVRDEAALAAALPTADRFAPPAAGTSPGRFVAVLELANAAELRSVLAPTGLRLCRDTALRSGQHQRRCTTTPTARVTAAVVARMRRELGHLAAVMSDEGFSDGALTPECTRDGALVRCHASEGGPRGTDWVLSGEGATLRLVEATAWSAEL